MSEPMNAFEDNEHVEIATYTPNCSAEVVQLLTPRLAGDSPAVSILGELACDSAPDPEQ